jgi:hypothetical protein
MDSIPADLLEIKHRLDSWRATRKYRREPIPGELRQAAAQISQRYPYSLVRNTLKIDPRRLLGPSMKSTRGNSRKKSQTAFFKLRPADLSLPETAVSSLPLNSGYRLQIERPDGSRLTLTLQTLDAATLNSLCRDFLKG